MVFDNSINCAGRLEGVASHKSLPFNATSFAVKMRVLEERWDTGGPPIAFAL